MNNCRFLLPLLLMSSLAYSADETVAPKPFRLKDLEPGDVKYIPLRQLPDDLRKKVEDQNRLLEKRTTKSGIKYDLFDVGAVATEMPANERLRLAGKNKQVGQSAGRIQHEQVNRAIGIARLRYCGAR
jgi:hypothetical protein